MAVVSCPECSKKLKVADTSVGKKVKCTCGKIFVAELQEATVPAAPKSVAAPAPAAVASEKVYVSCTACSAKLKVATTSLGKKMKCPKCAGIFIASLPEEPAPAPVPVKAAAPPAEVEEEETPKPITKPAADDDEMDALFGFAQDDAKPEGSDSHLDDEDDDDEDEFDDEDDELVTAVAKGKAASHESDEEEEFDEDEEPSARPASGAKPVYPSRMLVNLFVLLLLLAWGTFFSLIMLNVVTLADLGLGRRKRAEPTVVDTKKPANNVPTAPVKQKGKKAGKTKDQAPTELKTPLPLPDDKKADDDKKAGGQKSEVRGQKSKVRDQCAV